MLPLQRVNLIQRKFPFVLRYGVLAVAVAATLAAAQTAMGQITAEALIGDSVSNVGSHSDVEEAIKRFSNRDELGARQFLETALRKSPNLPPVDLLLAKMYFLSGNAAAGLAYLEKTAMENPGDPEPYLILADQAFTAGQTIQAEALYEKAMGQIEAFDGNQKRKRSFIIRARNGHSAVAERRRQWQTASDDLGVLLKVDPDNATAHYRLGRALYMLKKPREGHQEFVKASSLNDELPKPNVASALMYHQLGQQDEAKTAFETAIKADRNDVKTLVSYAQWLLQIGDVSRAEQALSAARRLDAENLDVLVLSGVAARMAKKMKPAEDYFVAALSLSPSNGAVINQLALLLIGQPDENKRKRALEFAEINATIQPENSEANITKAWVHYQLGNNREADAALRKGLSSGNPSPDSNYLVAKMLSDQNRPELARQFLGRAMEDSNSNLFVLREDAEALQAKLGGS